MERKRLDGFAYAEINSMLLSMMAEGGESIRANYAWGVLQSAHLARALGLKAISVIEFGVAGGNGLLSLEKIAEKAEALFGLSIYVYGFDTGFGLPKPTDYRDMPNIFSAQTYRMDPEKLRKRLCKADLRLGLISQTLPAFVASCRAPVGFISVDVDLYSSTVDVLKILEADQKALLPRIHCYFDDIMGCSCAEFLGERLAIQEFNSSHSHRKISPIFGLWHWVPQRFARDLWPHMFYMAHILDHDLYCAEDGMVTPMGKERPLIEV
jgi:hypothetical protein